MRIKTDDNTRYFADRCSYGFMKLTEKQADKKMKQETGRGIKEQPGAGGKPGTEQVLCKKITKFYVTIRIN